MTVVRRLDIAAALAAALFLLTPAAVLLSAPTAASAQAANNPIPGIDIVVRKQPGGSAYATGVTDDRAASPCAASCPRASIRSS